MNLKINFLQCTYVSNHELNEPYLVSIEERLPKLWHKAEFSKNVNV